MSENLINVKINVLNSDTWHDRVYAPASTLYSQKWYPWDHGFACCKLAPTLAIQMLHHNYVIDRNEYLIFTLSESINPWVPSIFTAIFV